MTSQHAVGLVLLSVAVVASGCSEKTVEVDQERLRSQLHARIEALHESPEVKKALDELVGSMAAAPSIAGAGQRLMAAIGAEPGLQPAAAALVGELVKQPAVLQLVQRLMREQPGATPDQIGAIVERRLSAVTDGLQFDKAFDKAFEALLMRPDLQTLRRTLDDRIGKSRHLASAVEAIDGRALESKWKAKILAQNGGAVPDRARAVDILLDLAFSIERLTRWYVGVYFSPTLKQELAAGMSTLIDFSSFRRITVEAVVGLVSDFTFQKRAIEAIV